MSRAAAQAMRDLAECLDQEAEAMPAGTGFQIMGALARAHRAAADRIEARSDAGERKVPEEYRAGQAGSKGRGK